MRRLLCFAILFSCALTHGAWAGAPKVAATISPVHSLASFLLSGTGGVPELLVAGDASPHHFHLRPSGAAILEDADVIFWVSENLESSLAKPIAARAAPGAAVELLSALDEDILIHYEGEEEHENGDGDEDAHKHGAEDAHDEDDHEDSHKHGAEDAHDEDDHEDSHKHGAEDAHDEDDHEDSHKHGAEDTHDGDDHEDSHKHGAEDTHDGDDHEDSHKHGAVDPHVWLSPKLAAEMARTMAAALTRADPENAELYRRNLEDLRARLAELDAELREMLSGLGIVQAFAFHDAYGYFQRAYDLHLAGTILDANAAHRGGLSAHRVAELRETAEHADVRCVFAEPQFNRRALTPIIRGFDMEVLILDPLGAEVPPGAEAYFQIMRNLAKEFAKCAKE